VEGNGHVLAELISSICSEGLKINVSLGQPVTYSIFEPSTLEFKATVLPLHQPACCNHGYHCCVLWYVLFRGNVTSQVQNEKVDDDDDDDDASVQYSFEL
jgi:hypothetical protein